MSHLCNVEKHNNIREHKRLSYLLKYINSVKYKT